MIKRQDRLPSHFSSHYRLNFARGVGLNAPAANLTESQFRVGTFVNRAGFQICRLVPRHDRLTVIKIARLGHLAKFCCCVTPGSWSDGMFFADMQGDGTLQALPDAVTQSLTTWTRQQYHSVLNWGRAAVPDSQRRTAPLCGVRQPEDSPPFTFDPGGTAR